MNMSNDTSSISTPPPPSSLARLHSFPFSRNRLTGGSDGGGSDCQRDKRRGSNRKRRTRTTTTGNEQRKLNYSANTTSITRAVNCIKLVAAAPALVSLFCGVNGTMIYGNLDGGGGGNSLSSTTSATAAISMTNSSRSFEGPYNRTEALLDYATTRISETNLSATMHAMTTTTTAATTMSMVNGTEAPDAPDLMGYASVQIIFGILYLIIFVLGIVGNVLVCYVVFRNKAMQTVTNYFITNLALSDILLCILAVPFTPLYTFLQRWVFGSPLCHIVPYAQGCSVYISTLTLTAVAIDRFFVIVYPFQPRLKLSVCIGIIVSIWVFALLVTLPYGLYMRIQTDGEYNFCEENWPEPPSIKIIFSICTTMLQFAIPFLMITFCYVCVSIKLNDRARSKPGSKTSKREEADRDRKKRTNRMLIAMVAVFGISWMPLNVYNILADLKLAGNDSSIYSMLVFFITHAIAMSSTCYNPFLYAWLNENFRKEFIQILPCIFRALAPLNSSSTGNNNNHGPNRNNNHNRSRRCMGPTSTYDPERLIDHHNRDTAGGGASGNTNSYNNGVGNGSEGGCDVEQKLLNNNCDSQGMTMLTGKGGGSACQKQQDSMISMCTKAAGNVLLKRTRDSQTCATNSLSPAQMPLVDPISSCTSSSCTTATSSSTISVTGHQQPNSSSSSGGKATVCQLSPQHTTVDTTVVSTHSGSACGGGTAILETHFEETSSSSGLGSAAASISRRVPSI